MDEKRLIIIGVRHHSPACARHVRTMIETHKPAYVLIEGPADFSPHIADLRRPHALPIAIFSYHASATATRASYSPFCAYSPEWQALQAAWSTGATPLFCDLPAWHPEFGDRTNRYADPHGLQQRYRAATAMLERELNAEGPDSAWDALVEQCDDGHLPAVLEHYFDLLRPDGVDDPREAAREAFMGQYAAWALAEAQGHPVVLVCGGWHVNGVRAAARSANGALPPMPVPDDGDRADSYLTPYSYTRLDSFTGYAAGMPSPAYYHHVFDHGLHAAADWGMGRITVALRKAGLPVSTADRIPWHTTASALARLRGHAAPLRADILDAALTALVKDALASPAAWTGPGVIGRRADDIVVAMLRALSGDGEGKLAPGTRQPPLIADVEGRLTACGITLERKIRQIAIDWRNPGERPRAHTLHQLCLLDLPGISRSGGPSHADARELRETFDVVKHAGWLGALIEAARWGGELPMAAAARLNAHVQDHAGDMDELAAALSQGLFAGLFDIGRALVADLALGVAACHDVGALGRAGRRISRIYRYGDVFGADVARDLAPVCEAIFARALWLCECVANDDEALRAIDAVLAVRDFARDGTGDGAQLALDLPAARAMFSRLVASSATPPALAGGALGYLVVMGDIEAHAQSIGARVRAIGTPQKLGDFLAGLFAVARESMQDAGEALGAVDELVAGWTPEEFLTALPAMRGAFAWFPPRERERLARFILQRAGYDLASADAQAVSWMRQRTPITDQAAAMALETRVAERLTRYGLN